MASRMRLRGPVELLSAMPYLLGFHPTDSLVALGLRGSGLHLQLRGDLPHDHDAAVVLADHYGRLFRRNGIDGALLVGYGPPARAEPFLEAVQAAMTARGITILDVLRTHEGRFWSLLCMIPGCCPAEGRPFDPSTTVIAAEATLAGMVALPSRGAVAASFAGPVGPALVAMEEAGNRSNLRMIRLVTGQDPSRVRAAAVAAGRAALEAALTTYGAGGRLTDDEIAWLQVLLLIVDFRDRAWERLDRDTRNGSTTEGHLRLWTDMVRRCEPAACAPSAVLLSYLSWRLGNGLHATLALDRALDADPGYSAAGLMAEILGRGLSPEQVPPIGRSRRRRRKPRRVSARALTFAHTGTPPTAATGDGATSADGANGSNAGPAGGIGGSSLGAARGVGGSSLGAAGGVGGSSVGAAGGVGGPSVGAAGGVGGPSVGAARGVGGPSVGAAGGVGGPSVGAARGVGGPSLGAGPSGGSSVGPGGPNVGTGPSGGAGGAGSGAGGAGSGAGGAGVGAGASGGASVGSSVGRGAGPRSRMRPRSRAGVCSMADGAESLADGVEGQPT
ncbi:DUF4192 domain-containing protein [Dactylosporangium sp. CS-033363]|uniref:DUF4192 domain-containing protein n=1 Tax=Dactylosporangium sp. CS-033363 TaxID=3239935 RepID=UPI003D8E2453